MTQKGFKKYLLYAIGEIILVMIGILLALQVNNWNESRKSKLVEIQIYKEIKDDLFQSLKDIEYGVEFHLSHLRSTELLINHVRNRLPINDTIVGHLRNTDNDYQFYPKTTGYQALKSIGLKTLTNDSLRQNITNLYELGFERIMKSGKEYRASTNFNYLTSFIDKYTILTDVKRSSRAISENDSIILFHHKIIHYNQFLDDSFLLTKFQEASLNRSFLILRYRRVINTTNVVNERIDKELKLLEK